jgi:hypothetical protein
MIGIDVMVEAIFFTYEDTQAYLYTTAQYQKVNNMTLHSIERLLILSRKYFAAGSILLPTRASPAIQLRICKGKHVAC